MCRNPNLDGPPNLLFLHGNVRAGYCHKDGVHGVKGRACSTCRDPMVASELLYPIANKDYAADPMIAKAWKMLRRSLKDAFMVTVFGYSAPKSDAEAVRSLQNAWGTWQDRELEQIEIIDIRDEEELANDWEAFIHTHHYDVHKSLFDSWLMKHPRRSGEAWSNQYLDARFIDDNPVPIGVDLKELAAWFRPLFGAEEQARDRP